MKGRMFKVGVLLDNEKIIKEGKHPLNDIYYSVEKTYADNGFLRDYDLPDGTMIFYGVNGWDDFRGYGNANWALEHSPWFMRYLLKWTAYENEQCDYDDEFCEEDLIKAIKRINRTAGVI